LSPTHKKQVKNKNYKMLASTIQFSNNKQTPTPNTHKGARRRHCPKLTTTQTMAEAPEPNNVHTPTPQAPHHTFHTHHTASSTHTANTQETRTRSMLPQKHPPPSPHHTRARKNSTTCRPRKNLSGTRAP